MDNLIIFGAKYLIILPVLIFAWFWFKQSKPLKLQLGWAFVAAGLLAGLADKIGSKLYYDPRPFVTHHLTPLVSHAADNGFPSEHTLLAATLATLIYFYDKKIGTATAVLAILIGASRVAAHVHSPIDIIGSLLMAALAGWIGVSIARRWQPEEKA